VRVTRGVAVDSFDSLFQRASARKGGDAALRELLPAAAGTAALQARPDDRYLAEMTRCVFRAGFVWQIVEHKWPGFEEAFAGFDVTGCALLGDEALEALSADSRIIRNASKIRSVQRNAAYLLAVRREHGSFGAFLATWPIDGFVDLWLELKRGGDRLGGQTGRFFLRFVGKDTPILSGDVLRALALQGVIDKPPTSRRDLLKVQDAFNNWRAQSGLDLCQISRVLAFSVED